MGKEGRGSERVTLFYQMYSYDMSEIRERNTVEKGRSAYLHTLIKMICHPALE